MKKSAILITVLLLGAFIALAGDIPMQSVDSSFIGKIGYDAETETLAVQMQNSSDIYYYKGVPKSVYEEFISSDSIGNYFVENIKGQYESK